MSQLSAAVVQLNSTHDIQRNLDVAEALVREAASDGARLVAMPELFPRLGSLEEILASAEPVPGPISERFRQLALELGILLCAGTICEASSIPGRAYNTSLLFDAAGNLLSAYRKIHLFEVAIPDKVTLCESNVFLPGKDICVVDTPCGKIGQATCFDLRFPELFRHFFHSQVDVALVPSAFTRVTGEAHWRVLVQARAIENQMFVLAPNQAGRHNTEFESYGHSMIVDPWGTVLAEASSDKAEVIQAQLDYSLLSEVRQRIPLSTNMPVT